MHGYAGAVVVIPGYHGLPIRAQAVHRINVVLLTSTLLVGIGLAITTGAVSSCMMDEIMIRLLCMAGTITNEDVH